MSWTARLRPSPAMVVALVALVVALGGSAWAVHKIGTGQIENKAVTTKKLAKGAVKKKRIKGGVVVTGKIGDAAVTSAKLSDDAVTAAKIASGAVAAGELSPSVGSPPFAARNSEPFREVGTAGQPTFANGWHNLGGGRSTAAYFKDPFGIVHLKGTLDGGAAGTLAFLLPSGYRPAERLFLPLAASAGVGNLQIADSGAVLPSYLSGNGIVGMDGVSFRAAQ